MKQAALAQVAAEKEAGRQRARELAELPADQRRAAAKADREAARRAGAEAKAARAEARAGMSRAERRADRRQARIYRKIRRRPQRAIGWGIVAAMVVGIGVVAAPYVSDISGLFAIGSRVDTSTAAAQEARAYGMEVSERIADEGIVLLKNEGELLPLQGDKLNVFGFASFNLRYGGGGSGTADQSQALSLYQALEGQGIAYNPDLYRVMEEAGAKTDSGSSAGLVQVVASVIGGDSGEDEVAPDYLTDEVMARAKEHSDVALVVVGNDGVEMIDFTPQQLRLTDNQRALFDRVTAEFDDVILVVNSGNPMELGFLDEYPQIRAALWIGTPGPRGAVSLARTLDGELNPSGRLTNTYAYDVESAPATVNFGDYRYANTNRSFINYEEGIYVGYRFYETYYLDDEAGYRQAVQFPFGYGLSYTDFEWKVGEVTVADDEVSVEVEVTNTGKYSGRDVVEAYYSAPYLPGGIEKSARELGAYAKTELLAPGASQTLELSFPIRQMASWDTDGGGYVLDEGDYTISVSTDIHSPVRSQSFHLEGQAYPTDEVTGGELANRFGDAAGDLQYLSRVDWDGTYPRGVSGETVASDELLAAMYPQIEPAEGEAPAYGADNGLLLADLAGLDYDDPQWERFLDQFSLSEQINLFSRGAYVTHAIDRLGIPSAILLDGPAGLNSFFGKVTAASFPTAVVVASTWNDELAYDLGEAVGREAVAYGVQGWYAPGMNIQRTALGGRNFEYYSEDPLLSGKMGAAMVAGGQDQGLLTFMKHFALNEQEVNARSGVHVWTDEQALREIYLRPFEITVKEGGANGAMSSFIHVGPRWSGGNEQLLEEVLRGEWGFDGLVSTDAVLGGFMNPAQAVVGGNDLMLSPVPTGTVGTMTKAAKLDPVGIGWGLRERVHQICYSLLQTDLLG